MSNDKKRVNIPENQISRGNDSSTYPNKTKEPQYLTYIVTDNKTTENGCVINKEDYDAVICRDETNANEK